MVNVAIIVIHYNYVYIATDCTCVLQGLLEICKTLQGVSSCIFQGDEARSLDDQVDAANKL